MRERKQTRLEEYDYSAAGAYFVTLCIHYRECLLGEIKNGIMVLNDAGRMVGKWWNKLQGKYNDVAIDEFVIMPNHFHGIVIINETNPPITSTVGAIPRNRPYMNHGPNAPWGENTLEGENMVSPLRGLGRYVSWFKRMTTNEYIRGVHQKGWPGFDKKLWQRNYHDRIVRDDNELHRIQEYISNNPMNWETDRENPAPKPQGPRRRGDST